MNQLSQWPSACGVDGAAAGFDYLVIWGPKFLGREAVQQNLGQVLLVVLPGGQHRHVCHIFY